MGKRSIGVRRPARALAWALLLCFALPASGNEVTTLSIMPAVNHGGGTHREFDPIALSFRERVVSSLVEQYECLVLSRTYGLSVTRDQALAAIRGERAGSLLGADWVITPMISRGGETTLLWRLTCVPMGGIEADRIHLEIPFSYEMDRRGRILADAGPAVAEAVRALAEGLGLNERAGGAAGAALRGARGRWAVMPLVRPPTVPRRADLPVSEMLEHYLASAGYETVDRARFDAILGEQALAGLESGTESYVGNLGRLLGAHILLRPVLHANRDAFLLIVQVIDARSGALIGSLQQEYRRPEDWVEQADRFIEALLDTPVAWPADMSAREDRLAAEADYFIDVVGHTLRMGAGGALTPILERGLEYATAAYMLARRDPARLERLLQGMNRRLVVDPEHYAGLYSEHWGLPYELTAEYRQGVSSLISEIIEQRASLGQPLVDEAVYRFGAHFIAGEYREALRIVDEPDFTDERALYRRVQLYYLLGEYDRAIAVVRPADEPDPMAQLVMAKCYKARGMPVEEMRALLQIRRPGLWEPEKRGFVYRLWDLMVEHESVEARLHHARTYSGNRGQPEYLFFLGRTWEEAGDAERSARYYRQSARAAAITRIQRTRQWRTRRDVARRLDPLLETGALRGNRAADIHPFPPHLRIYLQPLGEMDGEYLRLVAHRLSWFYGAEVVVQPSIPYPPDVYVESRNQVDARRVARFLNRIYPIPENTFLMAYVTPRSMFHQETHPWAIAAYQHALGTMLISDYYFVKNHPYGREDRAEALARTIAHYHYRIWRQRIPREARQALGNRWPNSADCLSYYSGSARDSLVPPGMFYGEEVTRLYESSSPERLHAFFSRNGPIARADWLRENPLTEEQVAYAREVEEALRQASPPLEFVRVVAATNPPDNLRLGLRYQKFDGRWTNLPDFDDLNPVSTGMTDMDFGNELPLEDGATAYRFEGWIHIPEDGEYGFWLHSACGSRMQIGDWVIDNDGVKLPHTVAAVRMLEEGYYPFRVDYFYNQRFLRTNDEQPTLAVRVSRHDLFHEAIPASWLFHEPAEDGANDH